MLGCGETEGEGAARTPSVASMSTSACSMGPGDAVNRGCGV